MSTRKNASLHIQGVALCEQLERHLERLADLVDGKEVWRRKYAMKFIAAANSLGLLRDQHRRTADDCGGKRFVLVPNFDAPDQLAKLTTFVMKEANALGDFCLKSAQSHSTAHDFPASTWLWSRTNNEATEVEMTARRLAGTLGTVEMAHSL